MSRRRVAFLAGVATLVVRGASAQAQDEPPEAPAAGVQAVGLDQDPNFQVDTTVTATRYSLSYPPGVPGTTGSQETLSTTVVAFATPLQDDDAPYTLQPFTQREDRFSFSMSGGHFDTANPYGGPDRTQWNGGLSAGFDAYVKRWLVVFAGASYGYFSLSDPGASETGHAFGADVGVGFRYRDTRLDLSAAEQGNRTSGTSGPWRGSLSMSLFTLIKRRVVLDASGTLVQGGGEGSFEVEVFPSKRAGVFASAFAGRFEPYADPVLATRYAGTAGFAGWFDASMALVGLYSLRYERDSATPPATNGYDSLSHTFELDAYFRFP